MDQKTPERQARHMGPLDAAMLGMVAACLGVLLLLLLLIPAFGTVQGVAVFVALAVLVAAVCVGWLRRGHRNV